MVNATVSNPQTHNYTSVGNHMVSITGGLERIHIDSLPSQTEKNKLRSIDQWGGHRVDHDGKRLPGSDQHGLQRPRHVESL